MTGLALVGKFEITYFPVLDVVEIERSAVLPLGGDVRFLSLAIFIDDDRHGLVVDESAGALRGETPFVLCACPEEYLVAGVEFLVVNAPE